MPRLFRALQVVAVNAVPAWGFFDDRWSPATTLIVYWCETVIATLLIAIEIVIHRKVTKKRGYYASPTTYNNFLPNFLSTSLVFTAAHGVFLAVIVVLFATTGIPRAGDVARGVAAVGAFVAMGVAIDLLNARRKSFASMKRITEHAMSRVFVVHFTIIFGMAVAAFTGKIGAIFGVFVALKLLLDLGAQMPDYDPTEPPRWAVALTRRVSGGKMDFAQQWRKDRLDRQRSMAEAELPMA